MPATQNRQVFGERKGVVRDALWVMLASSAAALIVNLMRPDGLALIAQVPYQILVPCPEPQGKVQTLDSDSVEIGAEGDFWVDAQSAAMYQKFHVQSATLVPYDYLDPTPPATLRRLAQDIAQSRSKRVLVYGDGEEPDSGEQLAKEISNFGIKNVYVILGGAKRLAGAKSP